MHPINIDYISNFSVSLSDVGTELALAEETIVQNKDISKEEQKKIQQNLDDITSFLLNEVFLIKDQDKEWFKLRRIVVYKNISNTLEKLRDTIILNSKKKIFRKKIPDYYLPKLNQAIKYLITSLEEQMPLPFNQGIERNNYYLAESEKSIEKNIHSIQKDYFHFLDPYLSGIEKKINIEAYEANTELSSFINWHTIVEQWGVETDKHQNTAAQILKSIQIAIPIALKSSYALELLCNKKIGDTTTYFTDLEKLFGYQTFNIQSSSFQQSFDTKYTLNANRQIPDCVLINDVTWTIITTIKNLKEGEKLPLSLGVIDHAILVEIERLPSSQEQDEPFFCLSIFNTGGGIENHFRLEKLTFPLKFENVPLKALNYHFISQLVQICLKSYNISSFYKCFEKELEIAFSVKKTMREGSLYPLQKYGTCTFTTVKAWIDGQLTEIQKKEIEKVMLKMATEKQEEVVNYYAQHIEDQDELRRTTSISSETLKRKRTFSNMETKEESRKKLKENQILLDIGKEILNKWMNNNVTNHSDDLENT